MWNEENNEQDVSKQVDTLVELDQEIQRKELENEQIKKELKQYRRQFNFVQTKINFVSKIFKKMIRFVRSFGAYVLGRRNLKQLYSRTYKIKNASNKLKPYKYQLYNLGFIEKSLVDLENLLKETSDQYLRRAVAWELALWYANKYTEDNAYQSLNYLKIAATREKDTQQMRRIAILRAECYELTNQTKRGKQAIQEMIEIQPHPDLYLAASNLEKRIEKRLEWINKVFKYYDIQPITFNMDENGATYEDLKTVPKQKRIEEGPKITVILPAYNFESGIKIAIESILTQTWQNIELLVVDDCSTDNTAKVIKDYQENDHRIKLFSTEKNSGPYVARNIALREATGEFITVNDADDWSHAEKIELQVKHLRDNPSIIANTSEHARLTEDLQFYRRGTPGKYIFSNMSSLMFRRKPVLEKIGYWDSVRFAADGEFKRRLIKTFGQQSIVDLQTGPLSLPRQSISSLTGSSVFGYSGFFMGVRKEYVESLEFFHAHTKTLYYPFPQNKRPFPVPEPMWSTRESNLSKNRHFDIVIAADFRMEKTIQRLTIEEIKVHKKFAIRTGFIQLSCYNVSGQKGLQTEIRKLINGEDVQMLVYGEKITCDVLVIKDPSTLQEKQKYIPNVIPKTVAIVIDKLPLNESQETLYNFRDCAKHVRDYFDKKGNWYPYDDNIRQNLLKDFKRELRFVNLSYENWTEIERSYDTLYKRRIQDWLVKK